MQGVLTVSNTSGKKILLSKFLERYTPRKIHYAMDTSLIEMILPIEDGDNKGILWVQKHLKPTLNTVKAKEYDNWKNFGIEILKETFNVKMFFEFKDLIGMKRWVQQTALIFPELFFDFSFYDEHCAGRFAVENEARFVDEYMKSSEEDFSDYVLHLS